MSDTHFKMGFCRLRRKFFRLFGKIESEGGCIKLTKFENRHKVKEVKPPLIDTPTYYEIEES